MSQDNREAGENPARSRRCKGRVVTNNATVKMGRQVAIKKPESEDLPDNMYLQLTTEYSGCNKSFDSIMVFLLADFCGKN